MQVLIVDDNRINVKLLDGLIRNNLEVETVCFTESPPALAWCRDNEPDLLFVDYMMPELDGLQFIEGFRQLPQREKIPIVMITAVDDRNIRNKALSLGANDFLNKPFDRSELIARTKNMLTIRKNQKDLIDRNAWLSEEVRKATAELIEQEQEVVFRMSRVAEYRSPETGLHVMRVASYCRLLARELGWSEEDQDLIFTASSMHDIGKVGTPDQILFKDSRLNPFEFAHIKLHTLTGYEIMKDSNSKLLQMAAEIAVAHHEKFNGSGYPRRLKGEEIPLAARICAISDVFDALTSRRAYKPAWSAGKALEELERNAGKHFDPKLVEKFRVILPEVMEIRERYSEAVVEVGRRV